VLINDKFAVAEIMDKVAVVWALQPCRC